MNINFQYPIWFIGFCLLAGLTYAAILYFKDDTFKKKSTWLNWLLGIFRFLTVSFISFLLLAPFIKSLVTETKKPIVILAQDNSESIATAMKKGDSTSYVQALNTLSEELNEKYEFKRYTFGSKITESDSVSFNEKESNLSEMLTEVYDLYSNQNLGAVILASDGIYNEGSSPLYTGAKINVPIYTIALGDTTLKKDISIKKVYHNNIAYLGDKFSIQVDVAAQNCSGNNTVVNISKIENGQARKIKTEGININNNNFFTTKEIILDANQSGVQRYRVSVNRVNGEVTGANNVKDIFIDVLDARQKILIFANAPHPDLSAMKTTISKNKNYEVDIDYASKPKRDPKGYDLIILHQIPGTKNPGSSLLTQINNRKIPRLFVVGSQSNISAFNSAQSLLNISGDGRNTNDVTGIVDGGFNLFTIDDKIPQKLPKFAPLVAPFGTFKASPEAQVLLKQKIGSVETDYPLMLIGEENGGIKTGILAAEGIWKWRVFDYLQTKNHDIFDELLGKVVQYLTIKEDKRKFRVSINKNIFKENESIYFDAELYNESYELVNDAEVSVVISNQDGKDFSFTFTKTSNAYTLNAGLFPVGNYKYRAKTTVAGKELTASGQFSVQPIQLEVFETTANHQLLRLLSDQYGGEMVFQDQVASIGNLIVESGNVQPVLYSTSKTRSLINLRWLFFVLLFFLAIEWFLRKFHGGY